MRFLGRQSFPECDFLSCLEPPPLTREEDDDDEECFPCLLCRSEEDEEAMVDRGESKSEPSELFPKDIHRISSRCSSVRKDPGEDIASLVTWNSLTGAIILILKAESEIEWITKSSAKCATICENGV